MRVVVLAIVGVLVAGAFALLPFTDGEVPCGPPLFGAEPSNDYSVVPGTCETRGHRRMQVATAGLGFAAGCPATGLVMRIHSRTAGARSGAAVGS